jgi:methyltransferase (TIGR00027 family)
VLTSWRPGELHLSDRPSSTAQWTTLGRALELRRPPRQRIVSDEFAPVFLSRSSQAVLTGLVAAGPVVRFAERAPLAGLSAFGLCRHRFIDEHLVTALQVGAEQVLILGAGYDSRAYRFATQLAGRPVFEVDLPPLSRRKAAIVAAHPDRFAANQIRRVEIDFRVQSLTERLDSAGFNRGGRTFVAWEGVTPYLSADAVGSTLASLAEVCGTGSRIAFDLWRGPELGSGPSDGLRRRAVHAFALIGEPLTFGIEPLEVDGLLGGHGFTVLDLARSVELAARYSTAGRPAEKSAYVVMAELGEPAA